jgi:hypothetical protein
MHDPKTMQLQIETHEVIISLDGATPRIVDQLNAGGQLDPNEGINLLRAKGFSALQNITITPSLTAAAHIAII